MDNSERLSHLRFVHKFDNGLLNFVAVISIFYLFFLILELYSDKFTQSVMMLVYIDTVICIIFMLEFFYFLFKAKNRWLYFKRYFLDFLASLPFMLLIWVSPQLAFLNLFKVLRGFKSILNIYEFVGKKKLSKVMNVIILFFLIVVYFSIIVVYFENNSNAGFSSFEDGLWWAVSTITTVGYGDVVPVTTFGKVTAMLLMIVGIGITSALGAVIVSRLLKPSQARMIKEEELMIKMEKDIENKQKQLSLMEASISGKLDGLERKVDAVFDEEKNLKIEVERKNKKKTRTSKVKVEKTRTKAVKRK